MLGLGVCFLGTTLGMNLPNLVSLPPCVDSSRLVY